MAVHALLVLGLLRAYQGFERGEMQRVFGLVMDVPSQPRHAEPVRVPTPAPAPRAGRPLVAPSAAPSVLTEVVVPSEPVGDGTPLGIPGGVPGGRGTGAAALALSPAAGDSRLWVRPVYIPEDQNRPINADSVIRGRLLLMARMADSLSLMDSLSPNRGIPGPTAWVVERDGKKWGIDQNAIHLGSFSLPTALLALIPMPQGNIDQARAYQQQMAMRADILRAAARSEAEDDFRRAVQSIRERRQRERDEQRAREQRERPVP